MNSYDADWFIAALNAMHDMIIIKGPKSQLLWGNQTFLDYYGMTYDDLQDIIDGDHSDPDDTLQYVFDDQTVFDTAAHLDIPQEAVTDSSGAARIFHTIKSPIKVEAEVVRTVGVSRLIGDTKINRRVIDHEDAKTFVAPLKALTESFPNPMLMVDVRKRVIHSSPLWDRQFGAPADSPNVFFDKIYSELTEISQKVSECLSTNEHVSQLLDLRGGGDDDRVFSIQISVLGHIPMVRWEVASSSQRILLSCKIEHMLWSEPMTSLSNFLIEHPTT